MNFSDKTVLVTGASRGIGYAIAEAFAAAGARLHILAETDLISRAAETLSADGAAVTAYLCDVTDEARVKEVVEEVGSIDILINNAGTEQPTPVVDAPDEAATGETFRRILDINVTGMFSVTRHAVKQMGEGGAIVNTASMWSKCAPAGFSAYAASKHAVVGMTRSWSRELGPRGIRVNAVCPGWVETEPALASLRRFAAESGRSEAEMREDIQQAQDLPGIMQPGDVAGLYMFLASPFAASITGQAISIDRGEYQG